MAHNRKIITLLHHSKTKFLCSAVALATCLLAPMVVASCSDGGKNVDGQEKRDNEAERKKRFLYDDLQPAQLAAAQRYGITPIANRDTDFSKIDDLELIEDCDLYEVDYLSHSVPYLTHNAKHLLETIAKDYRDSLKARGARVEKIVVTSVLRTADDVKNLQRVNSNAVPQSTHCYGTTFDIAHNHFYAVDKQGEELSYKEQKKILGHVLYRLRMQEKCWVLCEERQPCYHITVNY